MTIEVPGASCIIQKNQQERRIFYSTITPFLTGPTGGFGAGTGTLNIGGTTGGTMMFDGTVATVGTGSSGMSFERGEATGANLFSMAGKVGSGTGTVTADSSGTTLKYATSGIFTGTECATGTFNNVGSGIFGTNGELAFP